MAVVVANLIADILYGVLDPRPSIGGRTGWRSRPRTRVVRSAVLQSLGTLWRVLRSNPLTFLGFVLVAFISLVALLIAVTPHLVINFYGFHWNIGGPLFHAIIPYGPQQVTGAYSRGPSWAHPFGTDGNSFDIYSNTMLALPLDLAIGFRDRGLGAARRGRPRPHRRVLRQAGHGRGRRLAHDHAGHRHLPLDPEPHPRAGHHAGRRIGGAPGRPRHRAHLVAVLRTAGPR